MIIPHDCRSRISISIGIFLTCCRLKTNRLPFGVILLRRRPPFTLFKSLFNQFSLFLLCDKLIVSPNLVQNVSPIGSITVENCGGCKVGDSVFWETRLYVACYLGRGYLWQPSWICLSYQGDSLNSANYASNLSNEAMFLRLPTVSLCYPGCLHSNNQIITIHDLRRDSRC